jgi:hypothetical protein
MCAASLASGLPLGKRKFHVRRPDAKHAFPEHYVRWPRLNPENCQTRKLGPFTRGQCMLHICF